MSAKVITIFEDYPNQLLGYNEHLTALYKLRDIIGANNFSLQHDGTLQIMHYVGFFQFGNTRIQILPKIYAKLSSITATKKEVAESIGFVYRLLQVSGFVNVKKLLPQGQNASNEDLLEVFIEIFSGEFIKKFRRTVHRNYISIEENQAFIRGKIMVAETIRRNPILRHRHYNRFDEYSINNPLNQVFKALILLLLSKTQRASNKKRLVIGLNYLQDVDWVSLGESHFQKVKFNRLNSSFEPLFNLAKLFFYNKQPGLSAGETETFGCLIPLHELFENYVAKILDGFTFTDITFQYHAPFYYLAKKEGKEFFKLKPDFTAFKGTQCISILDAKYKYPFGDNETAKLNTADLYQLCTYALRYHCRLLVLIYPKFLGSPEEECIISEYEIQSEMGKLKLLITQIDILEQNVATVTTEFCQALSPYFNSIIS